MIVVNSKEFAANQKKYYDIAVGEQVCIKRGKNMFHLICANIEESNSYDNILGPDDDFRRAITADEFKEGALQIIDKIFTKH